MSGSHEPARRVAVVGAGITGLAAAYRLATRLRNARIDILESSDRAGGIIQTEHRDGFLIEHGPDAFITNRPGAVELCDALDFSGELIGTDSRYRRSLVVRNGRPLPVPDGFMLMAPSKPSAILTTPILSFTGRLRLLAEAIQPRRRDPGDESLASFVRRRFGTETLDRLVQPLVGGIYTSDPEKLSLQATLPRFLDMERSHGSVIRATLAGRKDDSADATDGSGARYGLFAAPRNGMQSLIDRLTGVLAECGNVELKTQTAVLQVEREVDSGGWMLSLESRSRGVSASVHYDDVLLTVPAFVSARLLETVSDGRLASELQAIEYASTAIVTSTHRLDDFQHPLDASGLVVPAKEDRRVLAVSFSSRKFRGRAPEGHVVLRTFVGGAMQPELLEQSDEQLIDSVRSELNALLGLHEEPLSCVVWRHMNAMPQYHVGHLDRVSRIDRLVEELPHLEVAGSAYRGVGIPDSISSGQAAADRLAESAD